MARLSSYFALCGVAGGAPVGAAPDRPRSDADCLLTLSRSVVVRYKLSDQKQVGGWTSRESLTAPVVFDEDENSYVGVFNESVIKVWNSDTDSLDKIKKIKFSRSILKLTVDDDRRVNVMFKDGGCASLSYACSARKNLETATVLSPDEIIVDGAIIGNDIGKYACYITKKLNEGYGLLVCELNADIHSLMTETLNRVVIKREELPNGRVIGMTISNQETPARVYVMWSDGRLFSYEPIQNQFSAVGQVPWLSYDVDLQMVWIGDNHIVLYGADSVQEGAVLVVFNTLFGVGSCRYPLKLFCPGARVWCLPNNLLLESQKHLAVVPYSLTSKHNALSLLGSNRNEDNIEKVNEIDWGSGMICFEPQEKWGDLAKQGVPERDICLQVLPRLLEEGILTKIQDAIKEFTDIPEDLIVCLITRVIQKVMSLMEETNQDCVDIFKSNKELRNLLDVILNLPFIVDNIITSLRNNFNMDNTIILIKYIIYLLDDKTLDTNFSADFEQKLLKWGSVLIDSHFQEILLSKNKDNFEVIRILEKTLNNLIEEISSVESVFPVIHSLCNTSKYKENTNEENLNASSLYSIEEIKLY